MAPELRRNGTSNSGYIKWPTELLNTKEGGSWVYLVVASHEMFDKDKFVNCCYNGATLNRGLIVDPSHRDDDQGPTRIEKRFFPNCRAVLGCDDPNAHQSVDLLAAICLGTSGGTWYHADRPWSCSYDDLDQNGKALYDSVKQLYNREPTLLTYIDT